jgi:hypothetical protein
MLEARPTTDVGEVLGDPSQWAPPEAEGKFLVVSRADGVGFADGCMTGQLAWAALMEGQPTVRVNPSDAAGLCDGTATLRSNGVAMTLPAEACNDVPPGVVAVSPRFPEMRALFAWAEPGVGPGLVSMETSGGND